MISSQIISNRIQFNLKKMLKQAFVVTFALICVINALHLEAFHQQAGDPTATGALSSGRVQLRASNGNYLQFCKSGCFRPQDRVVTPAAVRGIIGNGNSATWMMELRQGKVALKSIQNKYLTLCNGNGCSRYQRNQNAISVNADSWQNTLLQAQRQPNGKYAFKNSANKYLALCTWCKQKGTQNNDYAYFNADSATVPQAQWDVIKVPSYANLDAPITSVAQFCWKGSYVRWPTDSKFWSCPAGEQNLGLFCYKLCDAGYYGVATVCWQNAPNGWVGCGAGATPSTSKCLEDTFGKVMSIGEVVVFFASFGSSSIASGASNAANAAKVKTAFIRVQNMYQQTAAARQAVAKAQELDDAKSLAADSLQLATANPEAITTEDMVRIAASYAALVDKTGISGVVSSFAFPTCDKIKT